MFKEILKFFLPYFNLFKQWSITFLKKRWRKFKRVFERPRKFFKWLFIVVFMIKTKATPRNIKKFIRWCVVRFGGFIRSSVLIAITENFDYPYIDAYIKINLILFFFFKMCQELFHNFRCPLATLIYGKMDLNIKRHPMTIARMERAKKPKQVFHKFVADPFHNKKERIKQIAKAQAEFEAKVAINREKLKEWRERRRPAKHERVIIRKLKKLNKKKKGKKSSRWF